jgi:hypothetical protein
MTPRARRLLALAVAMALVLVAGRGLVDFLALRWWATAVSPEALQAVTRWQILGAALDVGAVLVASAWFAVQALLVARAIASVQIQRELGGLAVREALPTRMLLLGAIATGVILGLLTGAGAHDWRAPVALAWQGVSYGIREPILGTDLGTYVAAVPVWELAHGFLLLLVMLGLGFATVLYAAIGALGVRERRLRLHPDARRHLGGLLVLVALMVTWGYLLAPYRLAMGPLPMVGVAALRTRVLAAQAMAGAGIGVAMLTALWALRGRQSLVLAAWGALAMGAFGERVIVPAFVAEGPPPTSTDTTAHRVDGALYGLDVIDAVAPPATASGPPTGGVWDERSLTRWGEGSGEEVLGAGIQRRPVVGATWSLVTRRLDPSPRISVRQIWGDSVSVSGTPVTLGTVTMIQSPLVSPGGPGWLPSRHGVDPGGILRRVALAWAEQAPSLLVERSGRVDWALDPVGRVARLVPALRWHLEGVVLAGGGARWILSGLAEVPRAPLATRTRMGGGERSGVRPAMIATIGIEDGSVGVWLDPAADSLGVAWATIHAPLVQPASALPGELLGVLPYPREWFLAQVEALVARDPALGALPPLDERAIAGVWHGDPVLSVTLEQPDGRLPATIVIARRRGGLPQLVLQRVSGAAQVGADELERAWQRMPGLAQLRDSVRAAGDTLIAGPLHWEARDGGMLAWRSFGSAGRRGPPSLLWIGTMESGALGGGRNPAAAWAAVGQSALGEPRLGMEEVARLEALRAWMRRADSALQRRDMTAFGRAWEALRGLLLEAPPE